MKLKKIAFWQQTHQIGLVQTGMKEYPLSTVKYTAGSLMLWACFSARTSCLDTWHHGYYPCLFYLTEHKMKLLPWLSLSSDLKPSENEGGELKRRMTNIEL